MYSFMGDFVVVIAAIVAVADVVVIAAIVAVADETVAFIQFPLTLTVLVATIDALQHFETG